MGTMGIMDFIKGELIDVIEWTDDSRHAVVPVSRRRQGHQERRAADRSRVAAGAVRLRGRVRRHVRPGRHTLTTENIPVLTKLKSWKCGFNSPFKADVYFVNTRLFTGNKWGTANPVMMRDADLGVVRVRAFGTYDFRVVDTKRFLKEVAGSDHNFRLDEFAETMRSRIVSVFGDALASAHVPVFDVASRYTSSARRCCR